MAKDFFSGLLGGDGGGPMGGFNEVIQPTKLPEGAPYDLQSYQAARSALLGKIGASLLAAGQPLTGDQRAQYLSQLGDASGSYNEALKGGVDQRLKVAQLEHYKAQVEAQKLDLARQAAAKKYFEDRMKAGGPAPAAAPVAPTEILPGATPPVAPVAPAPAPTIATPMTGSLPAPPSGAFAPPDAAPFTPRPAPAPGPGPGPAPAPGPAIAPPVAAPAAPRAAGTLGVPGLGVRDEPVRMSQDELGAFIAGGGKYTDAFKEEADRTMKRKRLVPIPPGAEFRRLNGLDPDAPYSVELDHEGRPTAIAPIGENPNKPAPNYRWVKDHGPGSADPRQEQIPGSAAEQPQPGFEYKPGATPEDVKAGRAARVQVRPLEGSKEEQLPPADASKLALAAQFKANSPEIREALGRGVFDPGLGNTANFLTGKGEQGHFLRMFQSGKDALQRSLSGAGMSDKEAGEYASRYLPSVTDSRKDIESKLNDLQWSLENVTTIVSRARGAPPSASPAPGNPYAPGAAAPGAAAPSAAGGIADGTIIANDKGERMVRQGGKWRPL